MAARKYGKPSVSFDANGYIVGWKMTLRVCHKAILDIKFSRKKKGNQVQLVEEQGYPPKYNFHPGDIFYDSRKAYEGMWCNALQHIKLAVQVTKVDHEKVWVRFLAPSHDKLRLAQVGESEMKFEVFAKFLQFGKQDEGLLF